MSCRTKTGGVQQWELVLYPYRELVDMIVAEMAGHENPGGGIHIISRYRRREIHGIERNGSEQYPEWSPQFLNGDPEFPPGPGSARGIRGWEC